MMPDELKSIPKGEFVVMKTVEEKARPPREGRTGQKDDRRHRQERQEGQPLAIIPDNMKKQDGPPPAEGG